MSTKRHKYAVHSSTIHHLKKLNNRPTSEWINKKWHIHAIEYCSTISSNKLLMHSIKQMICKNIMVSKKKMSKTKDYFLHDSIYMKFPEKANFCKQISICLGNK